ncbi:hypothetical protein D3C84_405440 [compost metagenome]
MTLESNITSMSLRASWPMRLIRSPLSPMMIFFWPSRSTRISAWICRIRPSRLNSSISTVIWYGSSAPSWRMIFSRTSSAAKKRLERSVTWSSGKKCTPSGRRSPTSFSRVSRLCPCWAETGTISALGNWVASHSRCGISSALSSRRSVLLIARITGPCTYCTRSSTSWSSSVQRVRSTTKITTSTSFSADEAFLFM